MPSTVTDHAPRLASVPRVRNLWVRLFDALVRRQLGKTMTPVGVIYARMPRLLLPQMLMVRLAQTGLSLDPTLVDLVQTRVSVGNGCTFCIDIHRADGLRKGHDARKLAAVGGVIDDTFTPGERAALAYADDVCRTGEPSDATFAAVRALFDERQIVEINWLCAFTTYLNRLARGLGIGSDGFCELRALKSG
jgi:AhpD family alkylhydroperoxidase